MVWWDSQFLSKLEKLEIVPDLYTRFKDDVDTILEALKPGTVISKDKLVICEEQKLKDENLSSDIITMRVLTELANSIDPMIKFSFDVPSNYEENMVPILDLKVGITNEGLVIHEYFEKKTKNKYVILASSALSWNQKRNILFQETMRHLLNTNTGIEAQSRILTEFMLKLKRSGYSEKFRENLILKAKAAYKKIVQNDFLGLKPMFRNSEEQETHKKNKLKNRKWWNKGGKTFSNVLFVPATPGGVLASRMQKRIAELNPSSVNQLKVIEKGGVKLKNILVEKDPFGTKLCQNLRCPVCYETEFTKPVGCSKIPCTSMSVGYQIKFM